MSIDDRPRDDGWPGWLATLRPDEVARARMRRAILVAAAPLLAARRPASWWDVAAGWSGLAAPIAAAIALLFAWLAYDAGPPRPGPETFEMEALVQPSLQAAPPALLLDQSEPSRDGVLEATLRREGP